MRWVKASVSFPDHLLDWIDAEAERTGQTRQAWIVNTMWIVQAVEAKRLTTEGTETNGIR